MLALSHRYDLVVICKPRLPGLLLGLLLAEQSRCPIVIDVDESEQAFMEHHGGGDGAADAASLLSEPFGAVGTELAASLLEVADARTASSPLLQMEYGGHLVRHARDEAACLPTRAEARRRLGFADSDFVMAFVGTIRPHKGLDTVLSAIEALDDPSLRLLLVGPVHDAALRARLAAQPHGRVVHHEATSLGTLGGFLAAADLVPLLQDPAARITQTQVPAKLADALQHGVPVVASDVPPLRDLARRGVVDLIVPQDFPGYLAAMRSRGHSAELARAARRVFDGEFSLEVNRARLNLAIDEAMRSFNPVRLRASEALAVLRRATRRVAALPVVLPAPSPDAQDLVFFWKQNDSGLFGRRSDMVVKYLRRSGRFRRILHFDLPLPMFDLRNMARAHQGGAATTGAMQARGSIARALGLADAPDQAGQPGLSCTLMLTHSLANESVVAGQHTHDPAAFTDFVLARMRENGMDPSTTLAWVCPVVWGFGEIASRLGFARVAVDLIDDQRSWKTDAPRRARMEEEYAATLAVADLVLTNCAGNRKRFLNLYPDIHVVPNGAEFDASVDAIAVPEALAALPRPVLGYVGNMRNRVDWDLIAEIAIARPAWSIALLGPLDNPEAAAEMAQHPNVHLLGPVVYEAMRSCLAHFDVAIVPHRMDAMTEAMNPLKVYNYLAAGRPVVATAIANMEDVQDLIAVAPDAAGFIAAVEHALAEGDAAPALNPQRAAELSWSGRIATILRLLDRLPGTARDSDSAQDSGSARDEGQRGPGQAPRLVADNACGQAEFGQPVGEVAAKIGVHQ